MKVSSAMMDVRDQVSMGRFGDHPSCVIDPITPLNSTCIGAALSRCVLGGAVTGGRDSDAYHAVTP